MKFDWFAPWRFRCGWRRIKRFLAWFPIIWHDEDWDQAYLYEIMRFKISRMRADIAKAGRHVGWEKTVRDMKIAEELLNRHAFSNFYWDNDQKNKDHCVCTEEMFDNWLSEGRSPFCDWCSRKPQRRRQPLKEDADLKYLFEFIGKKSTRWWN